MAALVCGVGGVGMICPYQIHVKVCYFSTRSHFSNKKYFLIFQIWPKCVTFISSSMCVVHKYLKIL